MVGVDSGRLGGVAQPEPVAEALGREIDDLLQNRGVGGTGGAEVPGPVVGPSDVALGGLGLGGVVGSGRQYMSWVALDDVLGALHHALVTEGLEGPFNLVAPEPATNREFTKTLGQVLGRPTVAPVPAFALRLALGAGMADATLLASSRVRPDVLRESGYDFRFPTLEGALRHVLGKWAPGTSEPSRS